ncbi:metal ABC transporter permease [Stieleria varia]|uniref:Manganese transport system membrane protein MntB n=1 Tax=Stieleria varia TaxID=2528005 RepID=A0A5C5ZP98_9BACT|nr:metal ABC transporter permease [Stieleria varia]TWT89342.1 Manganese transport system membrane protein MntB [Stieleria varia]
MSPISTDAIFANLVFAWGWLDNWIVVVGCLSALAAALLGNFLVLRRMSMLGDAVTHAVLPGIAIAFLITQSRSSLPMFIGAVIVGVLTAVFTEWIRGIGKVDEGASMGVVFTSLFAFGLVLLVQTADKVDLDPNCVLYGAIELTPLDYFVIGDKQIPRAALVLGIVTVINALFVTVFFKELKISSFDPALATTMGISAKGMHYALMVLVSVTAVASFESVGSILVVAMFIVPPAAAYMLTDRLGWMICLSGLIAIASASLGHVAAIVVPTWFGYGSTTTSGMMAVVAGLLFVVAACLGPRHGVIIKAIRRQQLAWTILCDDVVGFLYRCEERANGCAHMSTLSSELFASRFSLGFALRGLLRQGQIRLLTDGYALTEAGRDRARQLVRSHRLWEQYLVTETTAQTDKIHARAHQFEHFTERPMRDELDRVTEAPELDPHGTPIPREET